MPHHLLVTPTVMFGGEDTARTALCLSLLPRHTTQPLNRRSCSGSTECLLCSRGRSPLSQHWGFWYSSLLRGFWQGLLLSGRCSFWGFVTTPGTCSRSSVHHPKAGGSSVMLPSAPAGPESPWRCRRASGSKPLSLGLLAAEKGCSQGLPAALHVIV